ncbi:hypothetical protein SESBI_11339 [Sesbania bispinosa]|nr:hypothetical protein SESBI_11339 [Sesbania bispinosa]
MIGKHIDPLSFCKNISLSQFPCFQRVASLSLAVHALSFLRSPIAARRRVTAVEGSFHLFVHLCGSCVPSRVAVRPKPYLPQPSAPLFTGFPPLVAVAVSSPASFSSRWLKIVLSLHSPKTKEWILLKLKECEFDFKEMRREQITNANLMVKGEKLHDLK